MYHYVRNNEDHFFETHARRKNEFEAQIDFFIRHSSVINPFDLDAINYYLKKDNESAFLLTFDDGYIDHLYCAEYLASKNINGYFFPSVNSLKGFLLDVNAIHILIGSREYSINTILSEVFNICREHKFSFNSYGNIKCLQKYIESFKTDSRFDDKNVLLLKRLLQRDLIGVENRRFVIDKLINKFINKNISLQKEIYLDIQNISNMKELGMLFGSHGNSHSWLNNLSERGQIKEIKDSFDFLKKLKIISDRDPKALCFPYGSYNQKTIEIMKSLNLDIGFTSKAGSAHYDFEENSIFKLSRWDTNDWWDSHIQGPSKPFL